MITREADYALRIILYLTSVREKRVSAAQLSEELEIPYHFLRGITSCLVKSKVLTSHRGQRGGMELARDPAQISVLDVVRAVSERSCLLNSCLTGENICPRESHCPIHDQLSMLQTVLDKQLGAITFDKLMPQ